MYVHVYVTCATPAAMSCASLSVCVCACVCAVSFRFRFTFWPLPDSASFIVLLLQLPLFQLAFMPARSFFLVLLLSLLLLCVCSKGGTELNGSSQPSHKTKIYNIRTSGFDPFGLAFIIFAFGADVCLATTTPSHEHEGESVLQINK